MDSIWTSSASLPQFPALEGDKKTDVLIIGGGIAGLLCAYFLQQQGVDYALAEGRTICSGVTKNTTAKITAQHGLMYHKLLSSAGEKQAALYLRANQMAVEQYAALCREIDCGFERKQAIVYSLDDRRKLEQEAQALTKLGCPVTVQETTELPFPVAGAVVMEQQAQFHPLQFLAHIARGLNIYEHSFVTGLKPNCAVTDKGRIRFRKAIFTTHFPIDNKHGMYFFKLYQHRSYVISLKQAAKLDGMYVDESKTGLSFRMAEDCLLVGGGSHRTGKIGGNWKELREFARTYYPDAVETGFWATQDCMSLDGVPYIGQYSKRMPDRFVATGFNKWGMTSSMVAAMLLTDLILEKQTPYRQLFDPARSMLKPQLFVNGYESVKNLLTISEKRCPHLGCALKWNGAEHSWDCPCHGSRFDEQGGLIDNPANGDLKR